MGKRPPSYYSGDLFGELTLLDDTPRTFSIRAMLPGFSVTAIAAMAAAFLSASYGIPLILTGLLLGLAMSFISQDERTHRGLDFASGPVLRGGIVLLGLQVTFAEVAELGAIPFFALIAVMAGALIGALLFARLAGQTLEAGILAGGATAICGASAALALYGVLGEKRVSQAQFTVTLVGISIASAIALSTYPLVAEWLDLTDAQSGFLTGAAIHDVAQAIGGGYAVSDAAGAYATVVKLARVALLAPLVVLAAAMLHRGTNAEGAEGVARPPFRLPAFLILFLVVLAANSAVEMPQAIGSVGLAVSKAMLLLAVVATAMRSQMGLLLEAGWRTFVPIMGATITSFAVAISLTLLLV